MGLATSAIQRAPELRPHPLKLRSHVTQMHQPGADLLRVASLVLGGNGHEELGRMPLEGRIRVAQRRRGKLIDMRRQCRFNAGWHWWRHPGSLLATDTKRRRSDDEDSPGHREHGHAGDDSCRGRRLPWRGNPGYGRHWRSRGYDAGADDG